MEYEKVKLNDGEIHCSVCSGTGILPRKEGGVIPCYDCAGLGKQNLCDCGAERKKGFIYCDECLKKYREEKSKEKFEKAKKVHLKDADKKKIEMMYSPEYGYNEGYFEEIKQLKDYCHDRNLEMPKYVYGTDFEELKIDMYDMISSLCEELHEGAFSCVSEDIPELQKLVDEWLSKQSGTRTYFDDEDYVILLESKGE